MKKIKRNRYVVAIIVGIMCYLGVYIAMPILFTTYFYIITSVFIFFCLFILGFAKKGNINTSKKQNTKKEIDTSIQQDIDFITTYIDVLSSVEKKEINKNDLLNIVREDNKIVLYSKFWNKIGCCNEKLSKMLIPVIDKGVIYEGIILNIREKENLQLEFKIVKVNCNHTIDSLDVDEELCFVTTVFDVNVYERKDIISKMKKGDEIKLVIAVDDKHDNNLIAVYNLENMKLGYLKRELSALLIPLIGNGKSFTGEVSHITVNENLEYELKVKIKRTNGIKDINEMKIEIKVNELTQYNISGYFKESSNTKIAKDILYAVGRQPQTPIYDAEWINIVLMISIMNVIKHKYNNYIEYHTGKILNDMDNNNQKKEVIQCYELYNHILNIIYKWEYGKESDSNACIYHPNYGLVNNEFILEEEFRPIHPISYMEFEGVCKNIFFKILKEENDEEYVSIIESRLNDIKKIIANTKESELRNIKKQWIEEFNERRNVL